MSSVIGEMIQERLKANRTRLVVEHWRCLCGKLNRGAKYCSSCNRPWEPEIKEVADNG
jgi:hypothetical protein